MLSNNHKAFDAFCVAIDLCGSFRATVFSACHMLKMEGKDQTECSATFTEAFKVKFPGYNFTSKRSNPVEQNRKYDNIRKAISDFWLEPARKAAKAAKSEEKVKNSVFAPTYNNVAPVAASPVDKEELAKLVLETAKTDKEWATSLAEQLLATL